MLKNLEESYTIKIKGKTHRAHVKFKELKETAKECAMKAKKSGYYYIIESVTTKMRNNPYAGVPHGAKYMVIYYKR